MGFLMFIWVFYFRYHLTLLCLFPPFFFAFGKNFPVWLVGKLVRFEFQQEIFFVVIDGSFVFS